MFLHEKKSAENLKFKIITKQYLRFLKFTDYLLYNTFETQKLFFFI